MKTLQLMVFLVGMTSLAQVKGNKSIETRTFTIQNVEAVKINLYAKVTIDQSAQEGLSITTDSNLFDLIDKEVVNTTLLLDQLEWIQPSQGISITIGAPNLRKVESGTHDLTKIINVNSDYLQILAPVGDIKAYGKTKELRLGIETANVDASEIEAENAFVNIWGWGKAKINVKYTVNADVSNNGTLIYINEPSKIKQTTDKGGQVVFGNKAKETKNTDAKYISFKIRNNSANRNHFKVVGPKPDGSRFGYGFPMMPFSTRKEKWTVGTKVYKVNKLGFQKLLVTIKAEDENKTVKLF